MADLIDRAQDRAQEFTDAALARVRRPAVCEGDPQPRDCADCGDAIPLLRLRAVPDAERCIDCQVFRDGGSL
ncbi:MAG: TraR/DksA C4-type zinc finger protein [Rhodocyclaceae bacterium]